MASIREQLIAARELISDPTRWTQRNYARDSQGRDVDATDPSAVCFCLLGAARRVQNSYMDNGIAENLANASQAVFHERYPHKVNDSRTRFGNPHAAVLAIYDRAIADCGDA